MPEANEKPWDPVPMPEASTLNSSPLVSWQLPKKNRGVHVSKLPKLRVGTYTVRGMGF